LQDHLFEKFQNKSHNFFEKFYWLLKLLNLPSEFKRFLVERRHKAQHEIFSELLWLKILFDLGIESILREIQIPNDLRLRKIMKFG